MYSPADLPSSTRAAPAKNRSWSSIGGISSLAVRACGLPVFSPSRRTKSSARASMASANFSRAVWRSPGVVSPHVSKAVAAAAYARSTSAWVLTGALATTVAVEGSTMSVVASVSGSTYWPPMKLRSWRGCEVMAAC